MSDGYARVSTSVTARDGAWTSNPRLRWRNLRSNYKTYRVRRAKPAK